MGLMDRDYMRRKPHNKLPKMRRETRRLLTSLIFLLSIVTIAGIASAAGLTEEKVYSFFANDTKNDTAITEEKQNETANIQTDPFQRVNVFYSYVFNDYRQSKGLGSLTFTDDLNAIALQRLAELKTNFSHSSQCVNIDYLGENIARGIYSNQAALDCWKDSPLHNANLLDIDYKYTGYAAGDGYAIQLFSEWITVNGMPQLPPSWYFSK